MSEIGEEVNEKEDKNLKEEQEGQETEQQADELEQVQKDEADSFKDKYFYLAAEMENMRKRFDREKQNLLKFGNEKILSDLVEVVDNLDRSLDALKDETDDKVKNIVLGVDMVRKQFLETLKSHGLERIEAIGEKFDPNFHEAMAQQPSPEHEDDEIILEYQKGYVLNGRLMRPAKVIVVKN